MNHDDPLDSLDARVEHIRARIADACRRSHRNPDDVTLIAVAKGHSPRAVARAVELGVVDIGESYVQEFQAHLEALDEAARRAARWHFIGHLQRNKVRHLVDGPALRCLHSLDSVRLAETLERRLQTAGATLDVLIEVNLADEDSKAGVGVDAARRVLDAADAAEHLRPCGLMCIPPDVDTPEQARPWFARLRELREALDAARPTAERLEHLSMGMSHDFEVAIEEGATLVRVGTALFGPRLA